MNKVLFVGGPRHGETIETDCGLYIRLPLKRHEYGTVICPIERLPDGQFIAKWPDDVEWRAKAVPKPEPKFKVGDRVQTCYGHVAFVEEVSNGGYWLKYANRAIGGGFCSEGNLNPAPTLEEVIQAAVKATGEMSPYSLARARRIADEIRGAFPEAGL